MSTLTSKDLHINRSSTRLHAPPGGKSSFSLGFGDPTPSYKESPNKAKSKSRVSQTFEAPSAPGPVSSAPSKSTPMMDPKLQEYMNTLSPDERQLFESMVNEEMNKLDTDFSKSNINDNPPRKSQSSYDYGAVDSQSSYQDYPYSINPPDSRIMNSDRIKEKEKQRIYSQQLNEASSTPRIEKERMSLHAQKQAKQNAYDTNLGTSFYSPTKPDYTSIQGIGNGSNGGGGSGSMGTPRRGGQSLDNEEMMKKRMAQQRYADQLASDSRHQNNSRQSNNNGFDNDMNSGGNYSNNSTTGSRRSSARNANNDDTYMPSSNANQSDMFSTMNTQDREKDKRKNAQKEYAEMLEQDIRAKNSNPSRDSNTNSRNSGRRGGGGGGGGGGGYDNYDSNDNNQSYGINNNSNQMSQRDKQRQYALDLAMDEQRKKEVLGSSGGGGGYSNSGGGGRNESKSYEYDNDRNYQSENTRGSGSGSRGGYNIPGLTDNPQYKYGNDGGDSRTNNASNTNKYNTNTLENYDSRNSGSNNRDYNSSKYSDSIDGLMSTNSNNNNYGNTGYTGNPSITNATANRLKNQSSFAFGSSGPPNPQVTSPTNNGSARYRGRSSGGGASQFSLS